MLPDKPGSAVGDLQEHGAEGASPLVCLDYTDLKFGIFV